MRLFRLVMVIGFSTVLLCGFGAAVGGLTGLGMPGMIQHMSDGMGYGESNQPMRQEDAGQRGAAAGAAIGLVAGLSIGLVLGVLDQFLLLFRPGRGERNGEGQATRKPSGGEGRV